CVRACVRAVRAMRANPACPLPPPSLLRLTAHALRRCSVARLTAENARLLALQRQQPSPPAVPLRGDDRAQRALASPRASGVWSVDEYERLEEAVALFGGDVSKLMLHCNNGRTLCGAAAAWRRRAGGRGSAGAWREQRRRFRAPTRSARAARSG